MYQENFSSKGQILEFIEKAFEESNVDFPDATFVALKNSKWVSVKDQLPPVGELVMFRCDYGEQSAFRVGKYFKTLTRYDGSYFLVEFNVLSTDWSNTSGCRYNIKQPLFWKPIIINTNEKVPVLEIGRRD